MSDELPTTVDVLRVVRPIPQHLPVGAVNPTWEAFGPSNEDKRYSPVRVSVWDSRRTSPQQAVTLRAVALGDSPTEPREQCSVFALSVSDIKAVGVQFNNARIRVVDDPDGLADVLRGMPGADGHSGIEGLEREKGMPKTVWKDMLLALAVKCKPALRA